MIEGVNSMLESNQDQSDEKTELPEEDQSLPTDAESNSKQSFLAYLNPVSWVIYLYTHYKRWVFGGVGLLFAGLLAFFMTQPPTKTNKHTTAGESQQVSYYPLPDIKLRMRRENGDLGYLVIGITLKMSNQVKVEDSRKLESEIMDGLHTYLSSITLDDFSSNSGTLCVSPVGLERIRTNIVRRLKVAVPQLGVESILFRKLIIQ